ncbi:aldolase [Sphingomonas sp. Root710]|uniref:class II aldolase/adducin family protein n=1 Tax=Sphingomonas sp. Root710 TaxID=1736594 RepID=UPI0006FFCA06|nr:class II aldolase/adducin family protein [Sphingomonas sp. Root710]KRB81473.1 aldolase [Sphingomonas sp. Root710]
MRSEPGIAAEISVRDQVSAEEWQLRVQLAACYRLFAHFGMTDLIYNHITARVPGTGHFLINAYGLLYDEVTASNLHKIDLDGNFMLRAPGEFGINPAGYIIHSAIHGGRHDAGCVIHTHSRAATAVSAMECGLLPLSQSAMFFYGEVGYHDFEGPAVDPDERRRLVDDLGPHDVMLLRNHGTITVGRTVPHAFLTAYQLESACRIQVDAMAGGRLKMPPHELCAAVPPVARDPRFQNGSGLEWAALLRLLDRKDPGYAV